MADATASVSHLPAHLRAQPRRRQPAGAAAFSEPAFTPPTQAPTRVPAPAYVIEIAQVDINDFPAERPRSFNDRSGNCPGTAGLVFRSVSRQRPAGAAADLGKVGPGGVSRIFGCPVFRSVAVSRRALKREGRVRSFGTGIGTQLLRIGRDCKGLVGRTPPGNVNKMGRSVIQRDYAKGSNCISRPVP